MECTKIDKFGWLVLICSNNSIELPSGIMISNTKWVYTLLVNAALSSAILLTVSICLAPILFKIADKPIFTIL